MKKKRRSRLEGRIIREAEMDAGTAYQLAVYGRKKTTAEQMVWVHLFLCHFRAKESEREHFTPERLKELSGELAELIVRFGTTIAFVCKPFLEALERRDGNALRAMAKEVENFRLPDASQDLPMAVHILNIKRGLDISGEKITAKQLAARVGYKGHDLSRFRATARSLGFPLAKDKVGRPTKSLSKIGR